VLALFLLVLTNSQRLELKLNLKLKVNKIIYTEACPGTIVAMYPYSRDLVGLHIGDAAAASGTESGGGGIYTSGTAVCAAQMGVNLRQSSGTVPL